MSVDISKLLKPSMAKVEDVLNETLTGSQIEQQVNAMCQLMVSAGGKRMRPQITVLCAKAQDSFKEDQHESLVCQFGAAIELLHTATLIHDDVIDKATVRRGVPTLNDTSGNHAAVLAGDYLFTRAFHIATKIGKFAFIRLLNHTIATLVAGEIDQLKHEGFLDLKVNDYYTIIYCKTGVLFEVAASTFVTVMDEEDPRIANFQSYGRNLGKAFQIIDDILDFSSDQETLGKPVGEDLEDQRITLPIILAIENTQGKDRETLANAVENSDFAVVKDFIDRTGSIQKCKDIAYQACDEARESISFLRESPYKEALNNILDMCVNRSF